MRDPATVIPTALVLLAFGTLSTNAHAQCSVRATARANSQAFGPGPADVSEDTGYLVTAPAIADPSSSDINPGRGCSGSMAVRATANYGEFHFTADGAAQTTSAGMFLSATGSMSFSETITIISDSLPPGTPVQMRYTVTSSGNAAVLDPRPVISFSSPVGACISQGLSGFGTASQDCSSAVGSTFPFNAWFDVSLSCDGLPGFGPISSTVVANIRTVYKIEILTPGVRFVTCSGNRYDGCGNSDFNGDGDYGTDQDIEAFFACLGGNCCPACYLGGADFNGDGDTGTDQDIESFFRVLGGGNC